MTGVGGGSVLRSTRAYLWSITVAFFLGGLAFAFGAPLFQAPDEPPHVDLIRHYAADPFALAGPQLRVRSGVRQAVAAVGLPQGGPIDWSGRRTSRPSYPSFDGYPNAGADATDCHFGPFTTCQNYHFVHPPSFYELLAPAARVLNHTSFPIEVLVLRVICVLLVTPIVPLTFYAAKQVWPDSDRRAMAAAAVVAFFPALAALAGAVNNDSLLLVVSAAAIAACARMLRRPAVRTALAAGVACGIGLGVKIEFIPLTAVAGVCVAVASLALTRPERVRCWVGFALPVVLGSWWWIRNVIEFRHLSPPGGEILRPAASGPWNHSNPLGYALDHGADFLGRFWGLYGQSAVETPRGWRIGLNLLVVGLVVGWLVARRHQRPSAAGLRPALLALFPLVLIVGALEQSFSVYRRSGEVRGLLGRYIYAALPVLAIAAVAAVAAMAMRVSGMSRRPPRHGRDRRPAWLLAGGTVVLAILALAGFIRVMHGFYGTRSVALALARADTVTAVPDVGKWLAGIGIGWLACVLVAGVTALRSGRRQEAGRERDRIRSATSPVQPVWWDAPSPDPSSPSKYS